MKNYSHKIIGIFNTQNLGNLHTTYKSTYLYPYAQYMLAFAKCLMSFDFRANIHAWDLVMPTSQFNSIHALQKL